MSKNLQLKPIGIVRSKFKTSAELPLQGGPARIEITPQFAPALRDIERSTHLYVLAFLDRADRSVLLARPRRVDPGGLLRGVFASRSPARPNPISLTLVPLLSRRGRMLHVDHLDLLDGTPVLDLKPYLPGWDSAFSARHERRLSARAFEPTRLLRLLERDLERHLGPAAAEDPARLALAAVFVASRRWMRDLRDPEVTVQTNRLDAAVDVLSGLLGANFANGRLHVMRGRGRRVFRFQRRRACLVLRPVPPSKRLLALPERWESDLFTSP